MGKSAAKIALGTSITAFSFANKSFGLFRSFEYLQRNAPALFSMLTSSAFEITLIIAGLSLSAIGLYEVLRAREKGGSGEARGTRIRSKADAHHQSTATAVGSIGNIGSGATVIVGGDTPSKEVVKPVPQPPPARPNINYCGVRRAEVFVSPWAFIGVREPMEQKELRNAITGIVLKFENDIWPDGSGRRATNVLAQIVYRFADKPNLRIDYGVWLGANIRYLTLDIGDTRELLLILQSKSEENNDDSDLSVLNDNRAFSDHFEKEFTWFRFENISQPQSVQVTVIEQQSKSKYIFDFDVTSSDGELTAVLQTETRPVRS